LELGFEPLLGLVLVPWLGLVLGTLFGHERIKREMKWATMKVRKMATQKASMKVILLL
jgi:hypothetical protein